MATSLEKRPSRKLSKNFSFTGPGGRAWSNVGFFFAGKKTTPVQEPRKLKNKENLEIKGCSVTQGPGESNIFSENGPFEPLIAQRVKVTSREVNGFTFFPGA
jgi:hypothetical protein